jgi:hypothetical protein
MIVVFQALAILVVTILDFVLIKTLLNRYKKY